MPWKITLFADECDPTFEKQANFIRQHGLDGLDLRSANGRNVLDLTEADLFEIERSRLAVQSIGSPVNKMELDWSKHAAELAKLRRALDIAKRLDVERVRIFSPVSASWKDIQDWMAPMVEMGESEGVVLLHENDARYYGAYPDGSKRLLDRFGSPLFKAAFDFANTVLIGFRPLADWFPWLIPHLDTLHIKDAIEVEQRVVPAGEGEGEIEEVLSVLKERRWEGTLSLEPHLEVAGPFGGFSGEDRCTFALRALTSILERVENQK